MAYPIRYGGLAVGVLAHYGLLVTTCLPYWKWSSWQISDPLYGRIPTFDGIWWSCMSLKEGGFTCNNYGKPTLYVEAGIQMCRGLMTVACMLSFVALVCSFVTVDCSIMLGENTRQKTIVSRVAGICFILAGLCTLCATSWFAWKVTYEFYNPYFSEREFKYDYGPCLYTGWISMAFAFLAGGFLLGNCGNNRGNYDTYNYRRSSPPKSRPPPHFDHREDRSERTEYI